MKVLKLLFTFAFVCWIGWPVLAQGSNGTQVAEMRKLDFLVGDWKGAGWIEMGPGQRHDFIGVERVQRKLGGGVLLVEGLHKSKLPGKDEEVVVHNALAVLSFDEQAKLYRFRANLLDGRYTDAEAKVLSPGVMQWGFKSPNGPTIRFTISLTDKGEWHEVGELSMDGKTWRQFFEMKLQRQS